MNGDNNMTCKCGHHTVSKVAMILIPLAFLLNAFDVLSWSAVAIIWPILAIIVVGSKFCRCCK